MTKAMRIASVIRILRILASYCSHGAMRRFRQNRHIKRPTGLWLQLSLLALNVLVHLFLENLEG